MAVGRCGYRFKVLDPHRVAFDLGSELTQWHTVNVASAGALTTFAVVRPDGTLLCYQPYGQEGLLIADIDLTAATGLLAARCRHL